MSDSESRAVIVTGSSRGIGRAIAQRLAADGHAVAVNYRSNRQEAEEVVAEITAAGGRAIPVEADVSQASDVKALFEATEQAFGHVSGLVNNAGMLITKPIADFEEDEFDRLMAVNSRGPFLTMREASRRMPDNARIVNLSTSATRLRLPGYGAYCASKSAVETLTAILSKEMRGRGITVNVVAPGPVGTELFLEGKSDEQVEHLAKLNPFERLGEPEDIARVVSFLMGPDGGWVNGQTLLANGGMA